MTTADTPPSQPTGRRRFTRRRLGYVVIVLMLLALLALLAVGIGRHLWQSEPDYWTRNQTFTASTSEVRLTDMADRAFNRILSELSDSRGYKPAETGTGGATAEQSLGVRTIRLGFEEANAWLATRLDGWLVNQKRSLPAGVSGPMLASGGDSLVAAFHYQNQEVDQVFSVLLSLEFTDDGQAVLSVDGVRGGRLPLPKGAVLDQVPGLAKDDDQRSQTVAVLLGQQPFDPILPIDGARRARIIGMKVDGSGVALVVQAEATN
jgi:hypothetical protein